MLNLVNVGRKSLADYASISTPGLMAEIDELAGPLAGKRVLHLSATAFGGGVAEINYTLVPLMADIGLEVEWRIIQAIDGFFDVTKTIHNALQGNPEGLTEEQQEIYRRCNAENARLLDGDWDIIIVHDAQPAAMIDTAPESSARWIWRCHIDLSTPNEDVLSFLLPSIAKHDAAIFHMEEYVPRGGALPRSYIWPPAIDPLAPKNMALPPEESVYIVNQFGIDTSRPLLTQVSRFDPWKDPLGVIDAYRLVKEVHPGVQLALVGSMAHDDPEGWDFYNQTVAYAGEDPDIFVLSNLNNVGSVEVNAFQVYSGALIQKSIREGFGLTVCGRSLEGEACRSRPRGRHRHADRARRDRLARRLVDRVRRRLPRDPGRPRFGSRGGATRQGTRAQALPHAEAAARLARSLQPPARLGERGRR